MTDVYPRDLHQAIETDQASRFWEAGPNVVVWFDGVAGDDVTGTGEAAHPYKTYDKAMASVPEDINGKVTVRGRAGTYTSTRYHDRRRCSRTGQFALECADPPVHVAGPFTVTAATEVGVSGNNSGVDVEVAGAGWVVDAFYRKFLRYTSGALSGCIQSVFSNTATHVLFPSDGFSVPAPGDTFEIIEPAMEIVWDRAPTFTWDGGVGRTYSQYAIINVRFAVPNMDLFDPVNPYFYGPFVFDGDGNIITGVFEIFGEKCWALLEQLGGLISFWYLGYPEFLTDPSLCSYWDVPSLYWAAYPSIQLVGRSVPPGPADNTEIVGISGYKSGGEWQTGIGHFCARQGIYFESPRGEAQYFMTSSILADHHTFASCLNCYLAPFRGTYAVRVDDRSYLDLGQCWIANSPGVGILCTDLSEMILANVRGDAAAIVQYGLSAGAGVRVKKEAGTTLAGLLGAIRFTQTDVTDTWPAAKNVKTDSRGSFVIR